MPLDILFAQLVEFWIVLKVTSGFTLVFKLPGKHNHAVTFSYDIATLSQLCWKYVTWAVKYWWLQSFSVTFIANEREFKRTLCFTVTQTIQCTLNCNHWSQMKFSVYMRRNSTFSKAEGLEVGLEISQEKGRWNTEEVMRKEQQHSVSIWKVCAPSLQAEESAVVLTLTTKTWGSSYRQLFGNAPSSKTTEQTYSGWSLASEWSMSDWFRKISNSAYWQGE